MVGQNRVKTAGLASPFSKGRHFNTNSRLKMLQGAGPSDVWQIEHAEATVLCWPQCQVFRSIACRYLSGLPEIFLSHFCFAAEHSILGTLLEAM